jgi:hypothetical protein
MSEKEIKGYMIEKIGEIKKENRRPDPKGDGRRSAC